MPRKLLKKSEYPTKINCLITNCLTMCDIARCFGGYKSCPNLEWKTDNMGKYDIEVGRTGRITKVYKK